MDKLRISVTGEKGFTDEYSTDKMDENFVMNAVNKSFKKLLSDGSVFTVAVADIFLNRKKIAEIGFLACNDVVLKIDKRDV